MYLTLIRKAKGAQIKEIAANIFHSTNHQQLVFFAGTQADYIITGILQIGPDT
jgi:hypothetical protein